jgi:hypothetical protein
MDTLLLLVPFPMPVIANEDGIVIMLLAIWIIVLAVYVFYQLSIWLERNFFCRRARVRRWLKKRSAIEDTKRLLEIELSKKIENDQYYLEHFDIWAPEEIDFVIPGFKVYTIKPV